jgi:hypothetical protein
MRLRFATSDFPPDSPKLSPFSEIPVRFLRLLHFAALGLYSLPPGDGWKFINVLLAHVYQQY